MTDVFDFYPFNVLTIPIAGYEGRWVVAGGLTLAFTLLARVLRGVTNSGAVAGAFSCFVLYAGGGPGAFAALATVFALAWITTGSAMRANRNWGRRNAARAGRHPRSWPIWEWPQPALRLPSSVMSGQSCCWR